MVSAASVGTQSHRAREEDMGWDGSRDGGAMLSHGAWPPRSNRWSRTCASPAQETAAEPKAIVFVRLCFYFHRNQCHNFPAFLLSSLQQL